MEDREDGDFIAHLYEATIRPERFDALIVVCAVSDPLILRIPGLGGLCHLSVEADGEAIWQAVWKVLLVSARLLSLGAETGGGQTR